jgi:hypothetical protein
MQQFGLFEQNDTADPRVDEFIALLEDRGWIYAKQIRQAKGWDEKTIRDLAAASEGQIIGGQKGYILTLQATAEERDRAVNWLNSQAKKMLQRAGQISRLHRFGPPTKESDLVTAKSTSAYLNGH